MPLFASVTCPLLLQNFIKNRFFIKPKGMDVLVKWLTRPVESEDIVKGMKETLLRFALMEEVIPKSQKIDFLTSFISEIRKYIKILEENYEQGYHSMSSHGILALENGIAVYRTNMRWGKKALKEIRKN